jgi:hypothetical protein
MITDAGQVERDGWHSYTCRHAIPTQCRAGFRTLLIRDIAGALIDTLHVVVVVKISRCRMIKTERRHVDSCTFVHVPLFRHLYNRWQRTESGPQHFLHPAHRPFIRAGDTALVRN